MKLVNKHEKAKVDAEKELDGLTKDLEKLEAEIQELINPPSGAH